MDNIVTESLPNNLTALNFIAATLTFPRLAAVNPVKVWANTVAHSKHTVWVANSQKAHSKLTVWVILRVHCVVDEWLQYELAVSFHMYEPVYSRLRTSLYPARTQMFIKCLFNAYKCLWTLNTAYLSSMNICLMFVKTVLSVKNVCVWLGWG